MTRTTFSFPTPTLFGPDAISELPARLPKLGMNRPLIVTDPGLLKTSAFQTLRQTLGGDGEDKSWFLFSEVHPNPVEKDVRDAAEAFVRGKCDGIVAIGGGSALDVGKAARLLVKRPELDFAKFY